MRFSRPFGAAVALLLSAAACHHASAPAGAPLRFESTPVPPQRSAVYPVTVTRDGSTVTVRASFFIGEAGYTLRPRVMRSAPSAVRLEVEAVRVPQRPGAARHYDYEAVIAAPPSLDLTVVHTIAGRRGADTVFRGPAS